MSEGAYLVSDDGELVAMDSAPYANEDLLQRLVADYPALLPGAQMTPEAPRRWLLVSREKSVPDQADSGGRWSLDHLLIDQDAIPTLVEVKRASDSRARREVVAQMLDYAANAVRYWSVDEVVSALDAECDRRGVSREETLAEFLQDDGGGESFWERFETNLRAGKVRMLFVADEIPPELLRIVEFLNEQMDPAEVLAVEIRQYVGGQQRALFPRLLGQTTEARQRKSSGARGARRWDEASFMEEIADRQGDEARATAARILAWARASHLRIRWGQGKTDGSFMLFCDERGTSHHLVAVWTNGGVEVQFQYMKAQPPMDRPERRIELQRRLNDIPGVRITDARLELRPSVPLAALCDDEALATLLNAFDWVLEQVRGGAPG